MDLEQICFKIISSVGYARSTYIEAIQEAKKGDFDKALSLMEEGAKNYIKGHNAHTELLTKDLNGELDKMPLLLLHAEDQLMSADAFKIIAQEFIDVYKRLEK